MALNLRTARTACALAALAALVLAACAPSDRAGADQHSDAHSPTTAAAETPRPRPEIPDDWPSGKRIVMHVTPSLEQSYVVACDLPVPALTYIQRGHSVTIAVDRSAITAFRRDESGTSPLDRLELLQGDLDRLGEVLHMPRAATPKTFGELYRLLATTKGIRVVSGENVLRAAGVTRGQLDPLVEVLPAADFNRVLTDLDALLPYDDIGPLHSIFAHTPGHESGHGSGDP